MEELTISCILQQYRSASFPRNACTVSRIKNAEKPEQDNYQQNHSTDFKIITTDSIK